jgi:hypothetical protein
MTTPSNGRNRSIAETGSPSRSMCVETSTPRWEEVMERDLPRRGVEVERNRKLASAPVAGVDENVLGGVDEMVAADRQRRLGALLMQGN